MSEYNPPAAANTTYGTGASGPLYAVCSCCGECGSRTRPLTTEVVTCPVCWQMCSCEGCVADADDSA